MKKRSWVYIVIVSVWTICVGFLAYHVIKNNMAMVNVNLVNKILITIFLSLNALILSYLWFGSIKDFFFSLFFIINRKRIMKRYEPIFNMEVKETPKFVLLYCTCNDFNENALYKSMQQDYSNFETIILDDSRKPEYMERVDAFSKEHNVKVIRRENRVGFKAGNLNNYLQNNNDFDYFVVLDSDEIIPSDYIKKIINYFYYQEKVGAVQASHIATKGENVFQELMGLSVKSNSNTAQIMKNFYGSNSLIGHGMTISKECYDKTGGFPHVVAEDISFAMEIKNVGYSIVYAPNIICQEEFPIDYVSLKKRQCKWTQGNVEFIKKYGKRLNKSNMRWYEKIDTKLSHYNLPIIPMLSLFLIFDTAMMGILKFNVLHYSYFLVSLMVVFLLSPLIPDLFVYSKSRNIFKIIPYYFLNMVTYASLSPMMIKTVTMALFGKKATFIVTPKENKKFSLWDSFKYSYDSLIFGIIIMCMGYFVYGSFLSVSIIYISCLLAPVAILLANITIKAKKSKIKIHENRKSKVSELKEFKQEKVCETNLLLKLKENDL